MGTSSVVTRQFQVDFGDYVTMVFCGAFTYVLIQVIAQLGLV